MIALGQVCLLLALVGAGYAAFACLAGWRSGHHRLWTSGLWAAAVATAGLTATSAILAWALVNHDFRFQYVADYSDRDLPWHFALSALWVGQAGSLLVWAWLLAVLALLFHFSSKNTPGELRQPAFGLLMANLGFLVAVMVFAADPVQPSLTTVANGSGLSPVLQHPAMLAHPPIVFLGYAAWGIPCALALAALLAGRGDVAWAKAARPWTVFAWVTLGGGILWGAQWAYEELGWGGYWAWDPVENGSLIPWLTGTALVHCLATSQRGGTLKRTALALAAATFALCNFATFLTRSGIFSSLHAFSLSSIGWLFLGWMGVLVLGAAGLMGYRRASLRPQTPFPSLASREAMVLLGTIAWGLLALAVLGGTVAGPLSGILTGQTIVVGESFYNHVLLPTGLLLLAVMALAPLLRWGAAPTRAQVWALLVCLGGAALTAAVTYACGAQRPVALAVAGLTALTVAALLAALLLESAGQPEGTPGDRPERLPAWQRPLRALTRRRRQYAGFLIHLGFACLAIGVTGSSLGTRRHDVEIRRGQEVAWAGRTVRLAGVAERQVPGRLVVEARLEVSEADGPRYTLVPAQHLYCLQNTWSSEVAIHSSWSGDFYAILHGGQGQESVRVTLIENPMMRWLWLAGPISVLGVLLALWPSRRRSPGRPADDARRGAVIPRPHFAVARRMPAHAPRD